ncbi:MAG: hypothetical protein GY948_18205 [Alphaproteobacteria bacterium]|nr:hypothetical protein [Alphaproteobacteria bacterium]
MKILTLSASMAISALLVMAVPTQALPPVGLSTVAPAAHEDIHYRRSLRPWHEAVEDRYCRRRARHICNRNYRQRPKESHTRYLQRNYCTTDLYEECVLARQIGNYGRYSAH